MNPFEQFYTEVLDVEKYPVVKNHLSVLAQKMLEGIEAGEKILFTEINNYHPNYLGKSIVFLSEINWTLEDCQTTIACEYGFASWQSVEDLGDLEYDINFEKAVNSLLAGNLEALEKWIDRNPKLINSTSSYGHQATLLHYTASNGVEIWRQKAPENLPEITAFLLKKGADKTAKMQVYGGGFTPFQLLTSSAHPYKAGTGKAMEALLK